MKNKTISKTKLFFIGAIIVIVFCAYVGITRHINIKKTKERWGQYGGFSIATSLAKFTVENGVVMWDGKEYESLNLLDDDFDIYYDGQYEYHMFFEEPTSGILLTTQMLDENRRLMYAGFGEPSMDVTWHTIDCKKGEKYYIRKGYISNKEKLIEYIQNVNKEMGKEPENWSDVPIDENYKFIDNMKWNAGMEFGFMQIK